MFVLIMIIATVNGQVATTTQEFSNYQSCYAAKQTLEATMPVGLTYTNTRTLTCVAK